MPSLPLSSDASICVFPISANPVINRRLKSFLRPLSFLGRAALCLGVLAAGAPGALQAQVPEPAQATAPAVSLGSIAIGSSVTATVSFTFNANTDFTSASVVTQGLAGLDFTAGPPVAGACATGTYAANDTCNVAVTFTPLAAGLRSGAVLLLNSFGNEVGVGYVYGSGSGATFETDSTAATQLISNDSPSQIINDVGGNLYVVDFFTSVVKLTPASVQTAISRSSRNPIAVAVDGAGYVYIFDGSSYGLYRTDPVSGTQYPFLSLSAGLSLAADPLGNLYIGQGTSLANSKILKYSSSSFMLLATISVPSAPTAIISDASGNLYYTVYMGGLYTIAAGGTTSTLMATNLPNLGLQVSLAFDAAGNLYIADNGSVLYQMPAGTHTVNAIVTGSSVLGVAVDGAGNLYYGNNGSLYKVDRTHPTASLSGATMVGSTSSEKTVSYRNIGSAASAISAVTPSANGKVGPSNTCSAATPVAINATCVASLQFAPVAQGSPQNATLTLTGPLTAPVFSVTADVAGDPTQLGFISEPPATLTSGNSPGTVTVATQDNAGTNVAGSTDSLTLTITGPSSPAPITVSAVNGVATFNLSGTSLTTVGTYTFSVTDNTRSVTGTATTEAVLPKYFTVTPASSNPIATIADTIAVAAYDNAGILAAYSGYVALTSTDAAATLPTAFALSSGQGTANVTFRTLGSQTVTARDSLTGLITGTSSGIQVRAVPSYIVTTGTDDNGSSQAANCSDQNVSGATHDANCSLRDAIAATNALNLTGTTNVVPVIGFALSGGTVTLAAALNPTANVNIAGPGAALLTIAPATTYTYNAFKSTTGSIAFTLSGVTVTGFGIPSSISGAALYFSPPNNSVADLIALNNDSFTNNGGAPGGNTASTYGGALYVVASTLAITSSTFTGNSAVTGGGLYVTTSLSVTIIGSTFGTQAAPNRALSNNGGAIYLPGSPATISTSSFSYNTGLNGSAIYATGQALTLNTDVFLNNAATTSGGAVFCAAALTVAGSTFNNNTAKVSGAAIYGANLLTVSGSSFMANQAGAAAAATGGAIYDIHSSANNSISNTNFLANRVATTGTTAYGGALYVNTVNLTNVLFSGNYTSSTSNSFGGAAFYASTSTSQFTGVTFTGNSTQTGNTGATTQEGGAIYLTGSSPMNVYNSTISGNSAKLGGGVYVAANSSPSFYNSVISGNTASSGYPDFDSLSNGGLFTDASDYYDIGMTCSSSCTPLLSALGNFGGGTVGAPGYTTPVQVMLPLPGSPLLAAGTTVNLYNATANPSVGTVRCNGVPTEPDARGCSYLRTTSYSGNSHVDIGAAEANYTLSFTVQPGTTASGATVTPSPMVALLESGNAGGDGVGTNQGSYAGGTLAITATPDPASTATVATTASGLESLSESFTAFTTGETLTANVQSGAATPVTVASVTSNAFSIGSTKTITFSQLASPASAGSTVPLVATASNGDPVTFSISAGTGTASINGTTVTYLTAGTVTVNADSAATSTSNAAPTVSYTVTITDTPYVFVVGSGSVASLNPYGSISSSAVTGGGKSAAVDASGYVWSINSGGTSVSNFTPAGTLGSTYSQVGVIGASALAIDGNSNIVIANGNGKLSVVSNAGITTYTSIGSTTAAPSSIAIDISGNIWVANPGANTVDEFIGGASPATPLANAVQSNTTGTKP
jgi:predicted outer membrane repeat protein